MFFKSDYRDLLPPPVPETKTDGEEASGDAIEEAPPQKKGFRLFMNLLALSCPAVLKANLLFLLCCLPIVTIPISVFAMNRVMYRIALDQPVKCFQLFKETFRQSWKQSYLAAVLTAVPLVCSGYGMWFYLKRIVSTPVFLLPFVVCSTIFLVTLLSCGCLYSLLAKGKNMKDALRVALMLGVAKPQRTLPAALFFFGLPLLAALCFPMSGMYILLAGFSLPCMIGNFLLRTVLDPFIDKNTYLYEVL